MTLSLALSGNQAKQGITDQATKAPFAGAVIADDVGQNQTLTVMLSAAANGTLSNLGGGIYNPQTGVYSDTGSAASVTQDLAGLTFIPTAEQVAPGGTVTTTFSISDTDTAASSVGDNTTSVVATAVAVPPTISNTVARQAGTDHTSIAPFSLVVIGDPNVGQTDTATVTLSASANGTLSNLGAGTYNAGVYTDTGSAAAITNDLEALLFVPTQGQVQQGQSVVTGFTLRDTSSAGTSATDTTTSVVATAVALPTISNTATGQAVTDQTILTPFATVVIADSNAAQAQTVTVTLSAAANGSLTNVGGGNYNFLTGVYSDSGSAASISSDLNALVFVPTPGQIPVGQSLTTSFVISDTDTAGLNVTDTTTSVVTTAIAPPAISNVIANQAVTDHGTIRPFAGVTITDANAAQTERVTVTLSTEANGILSNLGHGGYSVATGIYTVLGSSRH